jgi:hypothetical protein
MKQWLKDDWRQETDIRGNNLLQRQSEVKSPKR